MTTLFLQKLIHAKKVEKSDDQPKEQPKNIYDVYMKHLRTRKLDLRDPNLILEKHHVVPLHKSKIERNSPEDKNEEILVVTYQEHYFAHFYHFLVYNLPGDEMFLRLRTNVEEDKAILARQFGGKIAGKLNTLAQQEQRRKHLQLHPENLNPSKGGSVGSPAQKTHSAKLGKTYGKKAGMSRQNSVTKNCIQKPTHWIHVSGMEVSIPKADTIQEIQEILNRHVPGSVKHSSGLSALLRKVEKRRYGWILRDCSE